MFSRIRKCVHDLINHAETSVEHQQSANSISDELTAVSVQPEKDFNKETNVIQNDRGDGNVGRIKNEEESEVIREGEQVKNTRARLPESPEAEGCLSSNSCRQTGFCEFGMKCESNHPSNSKPQVGKVIGGEESLDSAADKVKEKDDSEAEQTNCKHIDHRGERKSGKACKLNQSREPSPAAELNFMGLPIRVGVKDCTYFMRHGSCQFGANCWFNHPDPISVGESDKKSDLSTEGSTVSPSASQTTPGSWSTAASSESPPYVPLMFPSTQRVPSHPEWHFYQAPVFPTETSIGLASGSGINSQPLEGNVSAHQQQAFLDEFPERLGQPECRSACKFHHSKSERAKSTSSVGRNLGLPPRSAGQSLIQEAVATLSYETAFTKMRAAQNLASSAHQSKLKQPMANPKKNNQKVRCHLCEIECPCIQAYENHLSGKKHAANLQKLHAPRITSPDSQPSQSINESFSPSELGAPSGDDTGEIPGVVIDPETKKLKLVKGGTPVESPRVCTICNVVCNGEIAFADHVGGKKHLAQAPVFPTETSIGLASGSGINSQPLEGNVSSHQQQAFLDEFPERLGQPECRSACKFHHPKSERAKSTSSVGRNLGLPPRSAGQSLIQEAVATLSYETAFTKMRAAQNLASSAHQSKLKQPMANPKKNNQKVRCHLCEIECPCIQAYENHLSGKKHAANLQKLHAPRITSPDSQPSQSINESFSPSELGAPSGDDTGEIPGVVIDPETKKLKLVKGGTPVESPRVCTICNVVCNGEIAFADHVGGKKHLAQKSNDGEMGAPSGKSTEGFTTVVTDSETEKWKSCSGSEMDTPARIDMAKVEILITDFEAMKQKLVERSTAVQPLRASDDEISFAENTAGKKHLTQERAVANLNPTSSTTSKPKSNDKTTKQTGIAGFAWCEVCKVKCTSFQDLMSHKHGKKHKANMENSQNAKTNPSTPPSSSSSSSSSSSVSQPLSGQSNNHHKDLEAKIQKVLKHGMPLDSVRICDVCNVVCHSEKVFKDHLNGQKHAANVKQNGQKKLNKG